MEIVKKILAEMVRKKVEVDTVGKKEMEKGMEVGMEVYQMV